MLNSSNCTHVVEQLSFSMFPSILTFDFDLILGLFLIFFLVLMGYFLGWGRVQNCFGDSSFSALSCSFEFVWLVGGGCSPATT